MRFTLLSILLAFAPPVAAQLRPALDVSFHFSPAHAVTNTVPLQLVPALQKTIATNLAADLYKAIPFWLPTAVTIASNSPCLEIVALKNGFSLDAAWNLRARLLIKGIQSGVPINGTLFNPSDYKTQMPDASNWSAYIQDAFGRELLTLRLEDLKALLARAPLGSGLVLTDRPPLSDVCIVLPLDWNLFKGFSSSQFRIECDSDAGLVTLHCVGLRKSFDFTPKNPKFPGVVAMVTERQRGNVKKPLNATDIAEFSSFKPLSLYLTTMDESGDYAAAEVIR